MDKENPDSNTSALHGSGFRPRIEAGEAQIVQDMLGKAETAPIAISPSNAKLIAQTLKTANPSFRS
ncbi:hypothetical protein F2981_20690 (plasmid) [Sinorhizobium meliloti]|nr:hypothetical protein [Sinorhizobium meliloti]